MNFGKISGSKIPSLKRISKVMSQKYTGIVRLKKDTNIESTERRDFCRFGGLERRGRYGHRRFSAVF